MTTPMADATRRPRGRRPAGEDTRGVILEAARGEFAARGYEGTTIRGIARAAGVDPRLVHHYFEGKQDIFVAALDLPARPQDLVPLILGDPADLSGVGERVVRFFFSVWDTPIGRERIVALLGAAVGGEAAARMLREFLLTELFGPIAASIPTPQAQLRATLVASQMIGLAVMRYVIRVEPLASAGVDELVPLIAPVIQRYLTIAPAG
jgi:AcrR family transcriptional regulator